MAWTSALPAARARIKALIIATTGIAADQVHNGLRQLDDPGLWHSHFTDDATGLIHGYEIARESTPDEDYETLTMHMHRRRHAFLVRGYGQVNDPQTGTEMTSELAFEALVELLCHQIREDYTLAGTVENTTPPLVTTFEVRKINGEPVHYCEIRFEAVERIGF